jgi:hypothetical protein
MTLTPTRRSLALIITAVCAMTLLACATPPTTDEAGATDTPPQATVTLFPPTTIPTITPTPVPTLTMEERVQFIEEMLSTNGDCELPCWWGGKIVPGQTTLTEASRFLNSRGVSHDVESGKLDAVFSVPFTPAMASWEYNTRLIITGEENGVVQSIKLVGDTYTGEPTDRFQSIWHKHYAWDHILTNLGTPSEILVAINSANYADPARYGLTLIYENIGLMITYVGPAEEMSEAGIRACPNFDKLTLISVMLVPVNQGRNLAEDKQMADPFSHPLEEITGMSVEVFYETFINSNASACFEQKH